MRRKPHLKAKIIDGKVNFYYGPFRIRNLKNVVHHKISAHQSMGNAEVK